MLNSIITIKIKQRINKLDSQDYDNIQCWQIVEAFNKAQVEWVRRQLHGFNNFKEGDEASTRRIDDLQVLLTRIPGEVQKKDLFYSSNVPSDYLQYKRIDVSAKKECCDKRRMNTYLVEEGNVNMFLRDPAKKPSFEWAETFATMSGNKFNIYTNNEFSIENVFILYYRQPRKIEITNCANPYTGLISTEEVLCELKDDVIELIIDDAASILAGDIESMNQFSRTSQNTEKNN
jgi:hypothetical protein